MYICAINRRIAPRGTMRRDKHTIRLDDESFERLQDETKRLSNLFRKRFTPSDLLRFWIPKKNKEMGWAVEEVRDRNRKGHICKKCLKDTNNQGDETAMCYKYTYCPVEDKEVT